MCGLQDYEEGHLYALEKFWAFHQYSGLPKDSGVKINPKVPCCKSKALHIHHIMWSISLFSLNSAQQNVSSTQAVFGRAANGVFLTVCNVFHRDVTLGLQVCRQAIQHQLLFMHTQQLLSTLSSNSVCHMVHAQQAASVNSQRCNIPC